MSSRSTTKARDGKSLWFISPKFPSTSTTTHHTTTTTQQIPSINNLPSTLITSLTSTIHTDATTIHTAFLHSLPTHLTPHPRTVIHDQDHLETQLADESATTHLYLMETDARVGKTSTGAPITHPATYHLALTSISRWVITIATVTPSHLASCPSSSYRVRAENTGAAYTVDVRGNLTLKPAPHGCTTAVLTLATHTADNAPTAPSSATTDLTTALTSTSNNSGRFASSPLIPQKSVTPDGKLILPIPTATALLHQLLTPLSNLYNQHARNDEVDAALWAAFPQLLTTFPPPSPAEHSLRSRLLLSSQLPTYTLAPSPPSAPYRTFPSGGPWSRSTAIINASASTVGAWLWHSNSMSRIQRHKERDGNGLRAEVELGGRSKVVVSVKTTRGVDDRVFPIWWTVFEGTGEEGSSSSDGYTFVYAPYTQYPRCDAITDVTAMITNDPQAKNAVVGSTHGVWRIVPLSDNNCAVTLTHEVNLGGSVPEWMTARVGVRALSTVARLQERFERDSRSVTREILGAMGEIPKLEELEEAEKDIVEKARVLLNQHTSQGNGYPAVVSTFVVDASVEAVAAWLCMPCNPHRLTIARDDGDLVRMMVKKREWGGRVAVVKRMPVGFWAREMVADLQAARCQEGVVVGVFSGNWEVQYGVKINVVRGSTGGGYLLTDVGSNRCSLSLRQWVNPGRIPKWVVARKILGLGVEHNLRELFSRESEVDHFDWVNMGAIVMNRDQAPPTADEEASLARVQSVFSDVNLDAMEELESPDCFIKMGVVHSPDGSMLGRSQVVIDETLDLVAGYELCKDSYIAMKTFMQQENNVGRTVARVSDRVFVMRSVVDFKVPGWRKREFVARSVWAWIDDDTLLICYDDTADEKTHTAGTVRGRSQVMAKLERLPEVDGVPQTSVTFFSRVDLGVLVNAITTKMKAIDMMMHLSTMRQTFDKSREIDELRWNAAIESYNREQVYTADELEVVAKGHEWLEVFENNPTRKKVPSPSPTVTSEMAFTPGDRIVWGRSECIIRCSKREAVAHLYEMDARCRWGDADLERQVLERKGDHSLVGYQLKKGTHGAISMHPRDGVSKIVWKRERDGSYLLVGVPWEHASKPANSSDHAGRRRSEVMRSVTEHLGVQPKYRHGQKHVRTKMYTTIKISDASPGFCKLVYVNQLDLGGHLPVAVMNMVVRLMMRGALRVQEHFQMLRPLSEFDDHDGVALGEIFTTKRAAEKRKRKGETFADARMRDIFRTSNGLSELKVKYPFLEVMLSKIVLNKLLIPGAAAKTKLCNVSLKEGRKMGQSFSTVLATNLTSGAAVDEFIGRYRSLRELDNEQVWFRPCMETVAQRLLGKVAWGLKLRVFMGAALSIIDLASDVSVVVIYWRKGEEYHSAALLQAAIVAFCLFLQLVFVIVQYNTKPKRFLLEAMAVLSGIKPAVDAYSVGKGKDKESFMVVDYKTELVFNKCAEVFGEAIPGCALQSYAYMKLLDNGDYSNIALTSIFISAATCGFTSAMISYDYDVDAFRRRQQGWFYGYIPEQPLDRVIIFLAMIANSSLLLLIRCCSMTLMFMMGNEGLTGGLYVGCYMGADHTIYLLQKFARGDFIYWAPVPGTFFTLFSSFVVRVMMKTIADFTCLVQFRHPGELGGLYWTFNVIAAIAVSLFSVDLYYKNDEREKGEIKGKWLSENELWVWQGMLMMGGAWVVVFGLFLTFMRKEYRASFLSTETGCGYIVSGFLESANDAFRVTIFKNHWRVWRSIREEVRGWVMESWWRWVEEKPLWFTESSKNLIPLEFRPDEQEEKEPAQTMMVGGKLGKGKKLKTTGELEFWKGRMWGRGEGIADYVVGGERAGKAKAERAFLQASRASVGSTWSGVASAFEDDDEDDEDGGRGRGGRSSVGRGSRSSIGRASPEFNFQDYKVTGQAKGIHAMATRKPADLKANSQFQANW